MCEEVNAVEEYIYICSSTTVIFSSFANESMNEPIILIFVFSHFLAIESLPCSGSFIIIERITCVAHLSTCYQGAKF